MSTTIQLMGTDVYAAWDTTNTNAWAIIPFPTQYPYVGNIPSEGPYKLGCSLLYTFSEPIPMGSTFTSASINATIGDIIASGTLNMKVSAQLNTSASPLSTIETYAPARGLVSGGTGTTVAVDWDNVIIAEGSEGTVITSPSIVDVMNQLSALGDISSIIIFIDDHDGRTIQDCVTILSYQSMVLPQLNLEYYADYTLTYDKNGGTGTEPVDTSSPYIPSSTVVVLDNITNLTKEGYEFIGWNTLADGTGTTYTSGSEFVIVANTILYALWNKHYYKGNLVKLNHETYLCIAENDSTDPDARPDTGASWQSYWAKISEWPSHNETNDIQGGIPSASEFYHLSSEDYQNVQVSPPPPSAENEFIVSVGDRVIEPVINFPFIDDLNDATGTPSTVTGDVVLSEGQAVFTNIQYGLSVISETITETTDWSDKPFVITITNFKLSLPMGFGSIYTQNMLPDYSGNGMGFMIQSEGEGGDMTLFVVARCIGANPLGMKTWWLSHDTTFLLSPHTLELTRGDDLVLSLKCDGVPCIVRDNTPAIIDAAYPSLVGEGSILGDAIGLISSTPTGTWNMSMDSFVMERVGATPINLRWDIKTLEETQDILLPVTTTENDFQLNKLTTTSSILNNFTFETDTGDTNGLTVSTSGDVVVSGGICTFTKTVSGSGDYLSEIITEDTDWGGKDLIISFNDLKIETPSLTANQAFVICAQGNISDNTVNLFMITRVDNIYSIVLYRLLNGEAIGSKGWTLSPTEIDFSIYHTLVITRTNLVWSVTFDGVECVEESNFNGDVVFDSMVGNILAIGNTHNFDDEPYTMKLGEFKIELPTYNYSWSAESVEDTAIVLEPHIDHNHIQNIQGGISGTGDILANILDDNCTSLDGWYVHGGSADVSAGKYHILPDTELIMVTDPIFQGNGTIEFTTQFESLGIIPDDGMSINFRSYPASANIMSSIEFTRNVIYVVYGGNSYDAISADIPFGTTTWRIQITPALSAQEIFMNDVSLGVYDMRGYDNGDPTGIATGTATEAYITSIKMGDGLGTIGIVPEHYHLTQTEYTQATSPATSASLGLVMVGDGLSITSGGELTVDEPAIDHNYLNGLQGGEPSASEYYHLTQTEHDNVERYSPLFNNMLVGTDTEILSSNNHSLWESINNNGGAIGVDGNDGTAIYRDSYGNVTNLGYLGIPSAARCEPTKINDSGIIVGNYDTEDYVPKGFYKLPNEDAITVSLEYVSSVNNNGVAVGRDSSNNLCTYDPINGVTNLGKFGYTGVYGRGINDNGDICGQVDDSNISKWFIRLSNDPDNLIVDAVDYGSCFNKINNDGDAVGYCTVSGDCTPLLRKSDGTIVKIDVPTEFVGDSESEFFGINNNGDAIGYFIKMGYDVSIGFIRLSDGTIIYLDQLNNVVIPYSINDSREIVGETTNSDWSEEYALYIPPLTNFIPDASTTKRGLVKVGTGLSIGEYNTLTVDTSAVDHNSLNGLQGGSVSASEFYHLSETAYATVSGGVQAEHNDLLGLQGGSVSASEFYHIDSTQHTNVERYSPLFDNMLVGRDTEILSTNYTCWSSINNNGEAIGVDDNDGTVIYRDSYGNVTNLGYLGIPSTAECWPTKINVSGIIVGYYDTGDYFPKGFYKQSNEDAITIPLIVSSVNNNGVAVGWDSSGNLCTYDPINGVTNLGKFGYTGVYGRGINDNGDICGSVDDGGISKWFIRLSNDPDNLIVDAVDYDSIFYGINNNGDAVGYCTVSGDWTPLLRKSDGTIVKIDVPTKFVGYSGCQFYDINNNGDAVGYFINSAWDSSIGFIRLQDGTINYLDQLNNVVLPYSINDSREIVGETTNSYWSEEYALYIPPLTNFIPDASTTRRGLVKVGDGLSIGEYNTLTVDTSAVDHNSLLNLSGGYYHLTSDEHTRIDELKETDTPNFYGVTISSTRGGGLSRKSIIGSVTLSAGSIININVPATSRIVGIQLIVDELITSGDGATSWSASLSGGSSEQICSEMSFTKNTTVHSLLTSTVLSETDIQITPDTGTFSGGIITAVCYYEVFENLTTI